MVAMPGVSSSIRVIKPRCNRGLVRTTGYLCLMMLNLVTSPHPLTVIVVNSRKFKLAPSSGDLSVRQQQQQSIFLCLLQVARRRNITSSPFQIPLTFFRMIYERFYQPQYLPPINEPQTQQKLLASIELMAIFASELLCWVFSRLRGKED